MRRNLLITLVLSTLLVFSACGESGRGTASDANLQTNEPGTSDGDLTLNGQKDTDGAADTRIVADSWGREVEIPANVESIICLGSGAPRIAAYLDAMDMLIGAEENDADNLTALRDYNPVHHEWLKSLPIMGAGGGSGNNNGYPEEIIMAGPDVILASFSQEAADELQTQTGIPVVCVRYISTDLANETFYTSMRVFAEVVGKQDRCEAVLSYIDDCKTDLRSRTADVPEESKAKAYTGAITFNGRHGFAGTSSSFGPFVQVNALNVADKENETGYYEVDLEQILAWDPDIIFLDPGNMDLVNDEYKSNRGYYDALRAVQEGEIYTMPSFNNCGMNISYALIDAYYAGIVLFPQEFADVDIEEKAGEILEFFLGENTFDEMKAGGLYYGKIVLGE